MRKTTLEVGGLVAMHDFLAVEKRLRAMPGVIGVDMNAASTTATIAYDESRTDAEAIRLAIEACGFCCSGETMPCHLCIPDSTVVLPMHPRAPSGAPAESRRHDHSHGAEATTAAAPASGHDMMAHDGPWGRYGPASHGLGHANRFLMPGLHNPDLRDVSHGTGRAVAEAALCP